MAAVEISPYRVIEAVNKAINKFKLKKELLAVPFIPTVWGTDKIHYDCNFCFKNDRLSEGSIPYYCAHEEIKNEFIRVGAKPISCINCDYYQTR